MAFPTLNNITTSVESTDVTTHDVTLPASVSAGDLIVVVGTVDGSPTLTWDNTTEGTWTELYNNLQGSNIRNVAYCIVADGTESSAVIQPTTDVAQQSSWISFRVPDAEWYGTLPAGISDAYQNQSNVGTDNDVPNISPGWGAIDITYVQVAHHNNAVDGEIASYPETSNNTQADSGGSLGTVTGLSSVESATASYDSGQFTLTTDDNRAAGAIAIRPADTGTTIEVPVGPLR